MRDDVRQEDRRALPKFLLLVALGGLFGGIVGFLAGLAGATAVADTIRAGLDGLLAAVTPWGVPVSSVVLLGNGWRLYVGAKRLYAGWDGEEEGPIDRAERKLSWSLFMSSLTMILDFFFLAAGIVYGATGLTVAVFLASVAVTVVLQQRVVALTRQMDPEKRGSVYDLRFHEEWIDSCDEAERLQIGQACYRAFRVGSTACIVLWLVLVLLNFIFDFGLLPISVTLVIWAVLQVTYTLECIRLSGGVRRGGC